MKTFSAASSRVIVKIKEAKDFSHHRQYSEATENTTSGRYSGEARLGSNGELLNYVAGLPFPDLHPYDPQAGLKLAWNFYWRWFGDDYQRREEAPGQARLFVYAIEKDGSERRADVTSSFHQDSGSSYPGAKTQSAGL